MESPSIMILSKCTHKQIENNNWDPLLSLYEHSLSPPIGSMNSLIPQSQNSSNFNLIKLKTKWPEK